MSEAILKDLRHERLLVAAAAVLCGDVWQLPDGRAGVRQGLNAIAANESAAFATEGQFLVPKTASMAFLDGQRVYWDHSANKAHNRALSDRDFFLGTIVGDAAAADTTCVVNLNVSGRPIIDLHDGPFAHVPVLTAGTPILHQVGGTARAAFSLTAEAQKLDLLSVRSFPFDAPWILEALAEVATNADADVADLSIGVANGTHASDADAITESAFFHFDLGADLNIDAESDDGTTEVNATDTTVDFAVGTPVLLQIDGRDPANLKYYINGVRVLSATTFDISAATGPLKALFHLEKSANDSPGVVLLHDLAVRLMEQP